MPLSLEQSRGRKPRRTVLYGPGGIGKTTFASQSPGVVFLPTEEGANDLPSEIARFPKATSWDQFMAYIGELATEPHEYKSLAIDTADWLEKLGWAKICQEQGVDMIGDIKYGRGYGYSVSLWQQLCQGLDWLKDNRDMAIIILAHAKTEKFEDPEHPSYDRYSPKLHEHVNNFLFEWADEVFFANTKTVIKEEDAGFNRTVAKAKGTGQRILRTSARPAAKAKNRLGMPDEIPFKWEEYAKYLTR